MAVMRSAFARASQCDHSICALMHEVFPDFKMPQLRADPVSVAVPVKAVLFASAFCMNHHQGEHFGSGAGAGQTAQE